MINNKASDKVIEKPASRHSVKLVNVNKDENK